MGCRSVAVVGTIAALLWTSESVAATITNRDDKDHKVMIVEGDGRQMHTLKPAASLQGICRKGCIIRLEAADEDYELDGSEIVSIEDGYLYYDGVDQAAGDGRGSESSPAPAK